MAFDEVRLPLKVGYGSSGGPTFSTEIVTIEGGYERRNQVWSQARRKFDARTGVSSVQDAALLVAFFQARAGRARGFRLKDWGDYTSAPDGISSCACTDQLLGTSDGATCVFQLIKMYGSGDVAYVRTIDKPVEGSVVVGFDGVNQIDGWTVDVTTGQLVLSAAPTAGVIITTGYLFDVPVRFDADKLCMVSQDQGLFQAEIPLIEIRV